MSRPTALKKIQLLKQIWNIPLMENVFLHIVHEITELFHHLPALTYAWMALLLLSKITHSSERPLNRSCSFSTNPCVLGSGEWVRNLTASYPLLERLPPTESRLLWESCFWIYYSFHPYLTQKSALGSLSHSHWRFWFSTKILMGSFYNLLFWPFFSLSSFYSSPQQLTCQYLLICPLIVYFNHQKAPSVKLKHFLFSSSLSLLLSSAEEIYTTLCIYTTANSFFQL